MRNVTTITSKNQITIPSEIARAFSLAPKDRMLIEKMDGWIKATPLRVQSFVDLYGVVKGAKHPDHQKLREQFTSHVAEKKH